MTVPRHQCSWPRPSRSVPEGTPERGFRRPAAQAPRSATVRQAAAEARGSTARAGRPACRALRAAVHGRVPTAAGARWQGPSNRRRSRSSCGERAGEKSSKAAAGAGLSSFSETVAAAEHGLERQLRQRTRPRREARTIASRFRIGTCPASDSRARCRLLCDALRRGTASGTTGVHPRLARRPSPTLIPISTGAAMTNSSTMAVNAVSKAMTTD
jgi:hypothetical protein